MNRLRSFSIIIRGDLHSGCGDQRSISQGATCSDAAQGSASREGMIKPDSIDPHRRSHSPVDLFPMRRRHVKGDLG